MKALSGRELARILESRGWILRRIHGSHHIYGKEGSVVRLSIPMHAGKTLKTGLQRHFMKSAGLTDSDLE